MSKITLTPNASGTGTFTVASPNSNTNRTITLPDADVTLGAATPSIDDNGNATAITIDSNENVGIGTTSPSEKLHVEGNARLADAGSIQFGSSKYQTLTGQAGSNDLLYRTYANHIFKTATGPSDNADGTERMRIDSSGNVGIGTSSTGTNYGAYRTPLIVEHPSGYGYVEIRSGAANQAGLILNREGNTGYLYAMNNTGNLRIAPMASIDQTGLTNAKDGTTGVTLDSSGNLLVGTTSSTPHTGTSTGVAIRNDGGVFFTRANFDVLNVNRTTSDGDIAVFRKDGNTVGSIKSVASGGGGISIDNEGSEFNLDMNGGTNSTSNSFFVRAGIYPFTDNYYDVGRFANRFDDIYATNGTIQTSDQNEKQQIASLTTAEMDAAKAISGLFKTFKWNDSVAEKGDAARTHAGVIAQEVEQAMTDAGLDAGDYAFFISTTWWETQTEVPAVEAVDAVYEDVVIPAVEEELDEEGNVIVEAQAETTEQRLVTEAVEAKDAYTRTDTYETLAEAPEGATERNRKGIRYPELLSFVGAATEQRLADIETRLTALEAV